MSTETSSVVDRVDEQHLAACLTCCTDDGVLLSPDERRALHALAWAGLLAGTQPGLSRPVVAHPAPRRAA